MITYHCVFCGHDVEDTTICETCEKRAVENSQYVYHILVIVECLNVESLMEIIRYAPNKWNVGDVIEVSKYFEYQRVLQRNFFGEHPSSQYLQKWPVRFKWTGIKRETGVCDCGYMAAYPICTKCGSPFPKREA